MGFSLSTITPYKCTQWMVLTTDNPGAPPRESRLLAFN